MELAGYRNRMAVLTDWAWAYFRFYRPARIIFGPSDAVLASWHQRRRRSGPPDDRPAS
jgi:NADH dehydrogenase